MVDSNTCECNPGFVEIFKLKNLIPDHIDRKHITDEDLIIDSHCLSKKQFQLNSSEAIEIDQLTDQTQANQSENTTSTGNSQETNDKDCFQLILDYMTKAGVWTHTEKTDTFGTFYYGFNNTQLEYLDDNCRKLIQAKAYLFKAIQPGKLENSS
jgi:hypothetical protein